MNLFPHLFIQQRLQTAVKALLPDADTSAVLVRPCPDPKFGDYQTNALMALAKTRRMNPRQLAADVLAKLDVGEWCEKVEIAGAGFLNFWLKPATLAQTLEAAARGEHLFFEKSDQPRTSVIDFSSPNVAKPMHVGHIRSTILGDCLARTLRRLGHRVITDNHIGDWGTQFGMLLVGWKRNRTAGGKEPSAVEPLVEMYRAVQADISRETRTELERRYPDGFAALRKLGVAEEELVERQLKALGSNQPSDLSPTEAESRKELVKLQAGDPENLEIWQKMIQLSQAEFDAVYARLETEFDHTFGESFYNPRLKGVVNDLVSRGLANESRGAKAVFSDGSLPPKDDPFLIHKEGEWIANPFIIQKQDGGFNYMTTDLATLAFRIETWQAQEIIYVTDARQQLHFRQLFATFRRWHPEANVKLAHVWFGSILGEDGKPFKTRSGETVRLADLLDEAEERAFKVVSEKSPELPEAARREIARVVGIGAVKYADLSPNRQSDYVFSWDKMLALNGNTAPYLQYAYARICSIFRKKEFENTQHETLNTKHQTPNTQGAANERAAEAERQTTELTEQVGPVKLEVAQELALAKHLLKFGLVLEAVAEEYRPNFLCNYLYELAGLFTAFYENCPVLKAEPGQRASRLVLCDLTARVLKSGLELLGIAVVEQM